MADITMIVRGQISNVRWLEQEVGAQKVRGERGWTYAFQIPADMPRWDYQALRDRIDGGEHGPATGCWIEEIDPQVDAEIAAEFAAIDAEQEALDAMPLHPAWANIAAHLRRRGEPVTNTRCAIFALSQVARLQAMPRNRSGAPAQRLEELQWMLDAATAAQLQGAGAAWLAARDWLTRMVPPSSQAVPAARWAREDARLDAEDEDRQAQQRWDAPRPR